LSAEITGIPKSLFSIYTTDFNSLSFIQLQNDHYVHITA
jgi:hypothetical protein